MRGKWDVMTARWQTDSGNMNSSYHKLNSIGYVMSDQRIPITD